MADAENNLQPSKKRNAGVQLTRDNNGLDDDDEDTSNQEEGTFRKASDEVLATRRIVKVRRHQSSSSTTSAPAPTSASNPFAGIRLTPLSSTTPVEPDASKEVRVNETEIVSNNSDGKSEGKTDDANVESADEKRISANEADIVQSETENAAPITEKNESNEREAKETETDVPIEKKTDEPLVTEAGDTKDAKDLGVEGNVVEEDKSNCDESTEKGRENAPVSSFGQLSSTQNAFSGLIGGGFPSSTPSAPGTSSLFGPKTDNPGFSFGASNTGSSSLFGSNIFTKSEGSSKNPPMQEVPIETGEENETTVFTADSSLFEFVDGSWKARGKGELKVNVPSTGKGQSRLVMRTKGNLRLILNANLFPDMKLTDMDKKGITFACINSASEGKKGLSTVGVKFRDASIAEDFRAAVLKHKEKTVSTLKTPEVLPNLRRH